MKKQLIILGLGLMLSSCTFESVIPESKVQEEETVVEAPKFEPRTIEASYISVENDHLNVREEPDIDSSKIGVVYENDKFQVLSEEEDSQQRIWYQVELDNGDVGYLASWFCAKTSISIYVEENAATIIDVNALPIPRYLVNPLEIDDLELGDQVVGFTISEILESEDTMSQIKFEGRAELTGTYYHEESNIGFGRVIRFVPDEASSVLLPRISPDITEVWFIVDNYEDMAGNLDGINTSGEATVVVSGYTIGYGTSDSYNVARLESMRIQ